MRKHKRCFVNFAFYDRENLEAYLEEQATRGWMVKKIRLWSASILFERIKPIRRHFCVVFHKNRMDRPPLTPNQQEFVDYCQHTGWFLAACANRMIIFYNDTENPIPIETDPIMEVQSIRAATKDVGLDSLLFQAVTYLFFLLIYCLMFLLTPVHALTGNNTFAPHLLIVGLNLAASLPEVLAYHLWYRKARYTAAYGSFPESKSSIGILFSALLTSLLVVGVAVIYHTNTHPTLTAIMNISITAFLAFSVLSVLRAIWTPPARAALRSSALIMRVVCAVLTLIVMSATLWTNEQDGLLLELPSEDLPISMTDVCGVPASECENLQRRNRHTQLISVAAYRLSCGTNGLNYDITYIHTDFIYDFIKKDLIENRADGLEPIATDANPWGANEAYRWQVAEYDKNRVPGDLLNSYFLCYDDCIVEINFSWEPTAEQMAIVGQKLGGE